MNNGKCSEWPLAAAAAVAAAPLAVTRRTYRKRRTERKRARDRNTAEIGSNCGSAIVTEGGEA